MKQKSLVIDQICYGQFRFLCSPFNTSDDKATNHTHTVIYNNICDIVLQRGQLTKVFPFMKPCSVRPVTQSIANSY